MNQSLTTTTRFLGVLLAPGIVAATKPALAAPTPSVSFGIKQLHLRWSAVGCEPIGTRQRLMGRTTHYGGSVMRKHQLVLAVALAWGNAAPMAGGGFAPR